MATPVQCVLYPRTRYFKTHGPRTKARCVHIGSPRSQVVVTSVNISFIEVKSRVEELFRNSHYCYHLLNIIGMQCFSPFRFGPTASEFFFSPFFCNPGYGPNVRGEGGEASVQSERSRGGRPLARLRCSGTRIDREV